MSLRFEDDKLFLMITSRENVSIVCMKETRIMYYKTEQGGLAPYYSENGKLCRWIDHKTVEVR